MKHKGSERGVHSRELKPARKYRVTTLERFGSKVSATTRMLTMKQILALVNKRRRAKR